MYQQKESNKRKQRNGHMTEIRKLTDS